MKSPETKQGTDSSSSSNSSSNSSSSNSSSSTNGYSCCSRNDESPSVLGPSEAPLLLGCLYTPAHPDSHSSSSSSSSSSGSSSSSISFAVVTMDSKGTPMEEIHDRMPLLLSPEGAAIWLEEGQPFLKIKETLQHEAKAIMKNSVSFYPVSSSMGNVRTQGPICVAPLDESSSKNTAAAAAAAPAAAAAAAAANKKRQQQKILPLTAYFAPTGKKQKNNPSS
ncbi:hypothetical protein, conserved [Eimeria brunetti]|uniref:Abasic site processing protein HMCES n=1 Tax=Eimeria brunetti TaxID=51314 RepID=U6LDN5_9EIME|nr:hypothetical protein, conserved [Eimeria brunetti]